MEKTIDMQVDLTGEELLALYHTALVGVGTMSGNLGLTHAAITMLTEAEVDPEVAADALRKVHASILLTSRIAAEVV